MIYNRYFDAKKFYEDTFPVFIRHEAQNTLPLGNIIIGKNGGEPDGWRNTKNWFMAAITDENCNILLSAIMTPPFNITMYETDNISDDDALGFLCENLLNEKIIIPGITSEIKLARRFAELHTKKTDIGYEVHKNMRIYTLDKVDEKTVLMGKLRKAGKKDLNYLPYWHFSFQEDCSLKSERLDDSVIDVERAIRNEMLFVLEDEGMPVSMASALREVVNGRCIGMVYTPPYLRKKGYASSCVAQVSQIVLDMGYQYVSLFTDLANPISNSIYQKIGYKPICDYSEIEFSKR